MLTPENELGVIVLFAQVGPDNGFEIKSISAAFPDAIVEKDWRQYRAEFEFMASAFDTHGHNPIDCDIIICWENDCTYTVLPVLALSEPDWMNVDLELPAEAERAAHYWKIRAMKAERALKSLQSANDKKAELQANQAFICEICGRICQSQHALNGHQNAHRTKGEQA